MTLAEYKKLSLTSVNQPQSSSVANILSRVKPIGPKTPMIKVLERFVSFTDLYAIPVVDNHVPIGLINRNTLIELFSKPFTRELYGNKEISQNMDSNPIIVDISENIDDLARIIINAGMQYMYDGFIITENDQYVGMGTGHSLLDEITERRQQHLYHLAHFDQLTGLPNRLLFKDRLNHAFSQACRMDYMGALLFMDLDRFKLVNDTYGHPVGDKLLKIVAERLTGCLRNHDTIARLCGDEFTVILENVKHVNTARFIAQKIIDVLSEPAFIDNNKIFIGASIGISLFPFNHDDSGDACEKLLKQSDAAMYHAKKQGRNTFHFYAADMDAAVFEHMRIENNLRYALEKNELRLYYQPQIDLSSHKMIGAEVLLRWQHPEMGLISPANFIPIAEETGLINMIGEFVLRNACIQAKKWQDQGLQPIKIAVNLSARQMSKSLPETVTKILKETGLDAQYLELELTENILLENVEKTILILQDINNLGVHVSIDDFGTGYSSLSYLQRLPINTLKIDRSFLSDVKDKNDHAPIITTIIGMAKNLKLNVIAEGLETVQQLDFLKLHKCDQAQGFYFSRPCNEENFTQLLMAPEKLTSLALKNSDT